MSQDHPNNSRMPDDGASEKTSRRRFLKESAAVAVGVVAAATIPARAEAVEPIVCGGPVFDTAGQCVPCLTVTGQDKDVLAKVIIRAWTETDYRRRLLTFHDPQSTIDWTTYTSEDRSKMLEETRIALKEVGFTTERLPVVLSHEQFVRGIFQKLDNEERVFQLPDPPPDRLTKDRDVATYAIDVHVCGM